MLTAVQLLRRLRVLYVYRSKRGLSILSVRSSTMTIRRASSFAIFYRVRYDEDVSLPRDISGIVPNFGVI